MQSGDNTPNTPPDAEPSKAPSVYRTLIGDRLARLVSPGTAQLYRDACKHMDAEPPLLTTTHTVANLLREIESSVRAVLRPLTTLTEQACDMCGLPTSDQRCKCGRPKLVSQKSQIGAILNVLGFASGDLLQVAWEHVADNGHKYAHRKNLDLPRPVDTEFLEYWSHMESVLTGVLDRFETAYTNVFDKLDELVQKTSPTSQDAKAFCTNFTNNQTTHDYFFGKLENPAWLPLLRKEGVFRSAPGIQRFEDGTFRFPSWPPAPYLKKMAVENPDEVAGILRDIEDTDNEVVMGTLVEIATTLPSEHRLSLMERLKKWI